MAMQELPMSILTQFPDAVYLDKRPALQGAHATFNLVTARAMAWAAQLSYETSDLDKLKRVLATWGWTFHTLHAGRISSVLPLTSAKGFIATCGDVSILTFAGTEPVSPADWFLDFATHLNADGTHEGFKAGVDAVWDTISAILSENSLTANNLLITGHSLGGALAVVAAHRLAETRVVALDRILGIYTFGMPRTGDETFVQSYRRVGGGGLADRTYRFIHGVDLVPQIPPSEIPFSFRHVGCALSCAHGELFDAANLAPDEPERASPSRTALLSLLNNVLREPPSRDLPRFPGDPTAAVIIESLPPAIRDHLMDRYLRSLGELPAS